MPVLGERVALCTWCSGIGPRTAERRTTVEGDRGGAAEAVAVWAHLDPVTGVPARLGERFRGDLRTVGRPRSPGSPPAPPAASRRGDAPAVDVPRGRRRRGRPRQQRRLLGGARGGPRDPGCVRRGGRAPRARGRGPGGGAARRGPHLGDEHPGRGPRVLRGQCEEMTRSMRPYSAASSGLKKRSRSMSWRTSSSGLPVCFA